MSSSHQPSSLSEPSSVTTLLERLLKDINSKPEEALPQSFSFILYLKSQSIPKVPRPPPDLEPFDININEQIQRVSNQYKNIYDKKKSRSAHNEAVQQSSIDIIKAMPDILRNRGNQEPTLASDNTYATIAERILYPDHREAKMLNPNSQNSVVNINQ